MSRGDEQTFPSSPPRAQPGTWSSGGSIGLTIREHYASLAMQGILGDATSGYEGDEDREAFFASVAEESVMAADALLAELAKPTARDDEAHGAETRG